MLFGRRKKLILQEMSQSLRRDMNDLCCVIANLSMYYDTTYKSETLGDLILALAKVQQKLDWDCRDIEEKIDEL